jgi:hypothetical protein
MNATVTMKEEVRKDSFERDFSIRTLIEFGRETPLLFLKFQLNVGHPLL